MGTVGVGGWGRKLFCVWLALWAVATFGAEVGYTPGEASVDPTGAANYRIPISVPPGPAGMQPELAFLYHSRAGNGLLGVGWSLEGLSAISRCPAIPDPSADGYLDSVRLQNSDRLCLDGQRLVNTSGVYWAASTEYRTELESFRKVTSHGSFGPTPESFRVHTNSGLILEYGATNDSRILAAPVPGQPVIATWALNRIRDLRGNAIDFRYGKDGTAEYWLEEITYGSNAVKFTYATRPDQSVGYHAAAAQSTGAGSPISLTRRLTSVETRAGGTVRKRYNLGYGTSGVSGRSLLTSVEECDGSNLCLPKTTFAWQVGERRFLDPEVTYSESGSWPPHYVDVDGDGRTDILYWSNNKWVVRRGIGFPRYEGAGCVDNQSTCHNDEIEYAQPFDLGGNGRIDALLVPRMSGSTEVEPCHSGNSFWIRRFGPSAQTVHEFSTGICRQGYTNAHIADMNGDGYPDLVVGQLGAIKIYPGTPLGFDKPGAITIPLPLSGGIYQRFVSPLGNREFIPFSFDGRPGLLMHTCQMPDPQAPPPNPVPCLDGQLVHIALDGGVPQYQSIAWAGTLADDTVAHARVADVNGDGLSDLLIIPSNSTTGRWQLLMNHGTRLQLRGGSLPPGLGQAIHTVDWRGGGAQTIVVPDAGGVWRYYDWSSAANDFVELTGHQGFAANHVLTAQSAKGVSFVDLNNTGLPDRAHYSNGQLTTYTRFALQSDLLSAVSVAPGKLDRETRFLYVPLTNFRFYTIEEAAPTGYLAAAGPLYVVAHVGQTAGDHMRGDPVGPAPQPDLRNWLFTSYLYKDGRFHRFGRGFTGFREIAAINANTKTYTVNRHRTDFPFVGLLMSTEQTVVDAVHLDLTYAQVLPAPASFGFDDGTCNEPGMAEQLALYCNPSPPPVPPGPYAVPPTVQGARLIASTTHAYDQSTSLGSLGGAHFPKLLSTVETQYSYEVANAILRRTQTEYGYEGLPGYDGFGNPTAIRVVVDDGNGGDRHETRTTSQYSNGTDPWCLGRVTLTNVEHRAPSVPNLTRQSSFTYENCQLKTEHIAAGSQLSLTTTHDYDGRGNRIRTTEVGGSGGTRVTSYGYDATGTFVAWVRNAVGHVEVRTHDRGHGGILSRIGPNGIETGYEYDQFGRLFKEITPHGTSTWARHWCSAVQCASNHAHYRVVRFHTSIHNSGEPAEIIEYDAMDREVARAEPDFGTGHVWTYRRYDSLGREIRRSLPTRAQSSDGGSILWIQSAYDALGRVTSEVRPRPGDVTSYTYNGLETTASSHTGLPEARQVFRRVNVMDRVIEVRDVPVSPIDTGEGSLSTSYLYDAVGNTKTVTDADGRSTTITYDARGFKSSMTTPELGTWTYVHDAFGQLTTQTDARGEIVTQQFDAIGRIVKRIDSDGTTSWTYDYSSGAGIGKLAHVHTSGGPNAFWEGYLYDVNGLLTDKFTAPGDGAEVFWTSIDYYPDGREKLVAYPDVYLTDGSSGTPVPAAPTLSAPTQSDDTGTFNVSWSNVPVAGIRYYVQQAKVVTGSPDQWTPIYHGDDLALTMSGLENNTQYRYRVRACVTECSGWSNIATVLVRAKPRPPTAPTSLEAVSTEGVITLHWSLSPDSFVTSQRLQTNVNGAGWTTVVSALAPDITSYTIGSTQSPLVDGQHQYRIRAANSAGTSAYATGSPITVRKIPPAPGTPVVTPSSSPNGNFTVEWSTPAGSTIDGYIVRIRRQPLGGGAWEELGTVNETGTSHSTGPLSGGNYEYRVRAHNLTGTGPESAAGMATVLPVPGTPSSIDAPEQVWTPSIPVQWGSASGVVTHYELYETVNPSGTPLPDTLVYSGNALSTALSPRAEGTYTYRVRACNASGCGQSRFMPQVCDPQFINCEQKKVTVTLPPGAPASISGSPNPSTNGSFTVSWAAATGTVSTYRLEQRVNGGSWTLLSASIPASQTTYPRSGLADGNYEYRVRAENGAGQSAFTTTGSAIVVLRPPGVPSSITVPTQTVTSGNIGVWWGTASGSVTRYELYEATSSNFSGQQLVYSALGTSTTLTGRGNGTYYYRVRACNSSGCSGYRTASSGVTVLHVPATPTGFQASPTYSTDGSYSLWWNASSGATSYQVEAWGSTSNTYATVVQWSSGTYAHRVRACNASGCSAWSAYVYVTVQINQCPWCEPQ